MKHFLLLLLSLLSFPVFAAGNSLQKMEGPTFKNELRYNSPNNFLKKNVYEEFGIRDCWVHQDLALKLKSLEKTLTEKKVKIVFWDCLRPLPVQEAMWKIVPDARYVANPKNGSNHNRGIAVDITLADEQGNLLEMPTGFDDFSPKASPTYSCKADEAQKCKNRDLLIQILAEAGLKPLSSEWWHFQLSDSKKYPLLQGL